MKVVNTYSFKGGEKFLKSKHPIAVAILVFAAAGLYSGSFMVLRIATFLAAAAFANLAYRSKQIPWLCVFVAIAIVFNPFIPFSLNNVTVWRVIDVVVVLLFGTFFWRYYDRYGKGHRFEDYVATLFPPHHWVVVDRTRDFFKITWAVCGVRHQPRLYVSRREDRKSVRGGV